MKQLLLKLFFTLFILSTCKAETITIVADEWPPFNIKPKSTQEGYMVDIARAVFEPRGIEVVYRLVPWTRAVNGTLDGKYSAVFGATKIDGEGLVFPEEELGKIIQAIYVNTHSDWSFSGFDSLKEVSIGVVDGYDYGKSFNEYISKSDFSKVQPITGENVVKRNIRKLLLGRVSAIVDVESVILWEADVLGVSDKIKLAGFFEEISNVYIAFSPKNQNSKKYAKILSEGIQKLRENGKLVQILNRYKLSDWK